jgi:hypothetical protein
VPSQSRDHFEANATDVGHLLDIHSLIGGTDPGRRGAALQVLNRSGIVLVCAVWEAYCEDLAAESLHYLVDHVSGPDQLPKRLKKQVALKLKRQTHDLSPWQLAGGGWKAYLATRLTAFQLERNRGLNTPSAKNIDLLFSEAIGLPDVSGSWYWAAMSAEKARKKLDGYIAVRGDIAHRGVATYSAILAKTSLNTWSAWSPRQTATLMRSLRPSQVPPCSDLALVRREAAKATVRVSIRLC